MPARTKSLDFHIKTPIPRFLALPSLSLYNLASVAEGWKELDRLLVVMMWTGCTILERPSTFAPSVETLARVTGVGVIFPFRERHA